jgi:hypothetical protein
MAATYTLHVAPHADPGDPAALDRSLLVRDGFSWGAFLVPSLWYLWHRHWLAALVAFVVVMALGWGLRLIGLGLGPVLLVQFLLHFLHGFEGPSIRRWLYSRAGRPPVDVIQAGSVEEAELKGFGRWLAVAEARARLLAEPAFTPSSYRRDDHAVIGLFPDAEGRA